jgi:hypothetical protein
MEPRKELKVSLKVAGQHYRGLRFHQALAVIWRASVDDKQAYETFRKLEKDQWFVGFISSCLSLAERPTESDWLAPRTYIEAAEKDYQRGDMGGAIHLMEAAVRACNATHAKLQNFLSGTEEGAGRGIILIEITNTVLIGIATAGVGEAPLLVRAFVGASMKGYQSFMTEGGKVLFDVEGKIDWTTVTTEFAKEFATVLFSGALAAQFQQLLKIHIFKLKYKQTLALEPAIDALYKQGLIPIYLKNSQKEGAQYLADIAVAVIAATILRFARKVGDKPLTVKEFVSEVLDDWGNEAMVIVGKALKLL